MYRPDEIYEMYVNGSRKDARRAIEAAPHPVTVAIDILEIARGRAGSTGPGGYIEMRCWFNSWPDRDA